jgi:hypothetical protein
MSQKSLPQASLVLVELGAAWPATVVPGDAPCRVLAEVEGEGPLAFANRAEVFAASAFPRGTQVSTAVVACNLRADETAEAARRALVESLLVRLTPGGELRFTAADSASDRFRRRLLDLAASLGAGTREGRIRASFGEDTARTSGPTTSQSAPVPSRSVARVA